ncbi:2-dehydropantoate 2-reductase [Paenibacillus sp. ACRRX]|uniref:ketopantoate reductase family protein n=1 Tax=Paenibacillus sp. ACRRX TaxID=2918206 RepID=UPI001EF55AFE|nr:2-dehydropantoate 2-reductase [Paenibacillus sp. ACRRX]MCG7407811.1 2-dehydropantoate 2-reductase [Paenibacillus sp. ACRRX]
MLIDIVGAGAVGLLYTSGLIRAGIHVRLWTRTKQQADILRTEGLMVTERDGSLARWRQVEAYPFQEAAQVIQDSGSPIEILGLFVKQTHLTNSFINQLGALPRATDSLFVCFQNGIGHMERLQSVIAGEQLVKAVTTEAATRVEANRIIHAGSGITWLGQDLTSCERLQKNIKVLNNLLNQAGFQANLSNNIDNMIYHKLLINAVINPITAMLRIPNGELLQTERRVQLMRDVYEEVTSIYREAGIPVANDAWDNVQLVCRNTAHNTSSMLADVLQGRSTEIDSITGELLRKADAHALNVPVQRALYQFIQALDPMNPLL